MLPACCTLERMLAQAPGAHPLLREWEVLLARPLEALEQVKRAMRLSPHDL